MSDGKPHTYGEITEVINDYFDDLNVRINAIKGFCIAIVMENALTMQEIDLLKAELNDKFKLD